MIISDIQLKRGGPSLFGGGLPHFLSCDYEFIFLSVFYPPALTISISISFHERF